MVSSTFSLKALASVFAIIATTNAHMIMKTPIPYGRGVINNSPLDDNGSDFPCKNIFDMTDPVNDVNHLVPGQSNTLSFTGSAVHGGGSCQVALTTDLRPTKSSKWMVIKSIEGGCPANVDGNLPADPNGNGASTFQYTVPVGFPEGQYTIAWTWFNRIGNREMYMNCGRAQVGNSKKRYALPEPKIEHRAADYPDIFKGNLKIFSCTVKEGLNLAFPTPGAAVQVVASASSVCGGNGAAAAPTNGAGSSSAAGAAPTTTGRAATTGRPVASATPTGGRSSGFANGPGATPAASTSTGRPGVFASGASSQTQPAATDSPQPTADATATVEPVPAVPTPTGGNNTTPPSGGSNVAGSACSPEGAWSCSSSGQSFQRCASGVWSVPMQVAAGTTCTPGTSMNLSMRTVSNKFHKRDLISHVHRARSLHLRS